MRTGKVDVRFQRPPYFTTLGLIPRLSSKRKRVYKTRLIPEDELVQCESERHDLLSKRGGDFDPRPFLEFF